MASELKPCPFCSKTMMLRSALWPSEGDADAIIHADPTDCPMLGFSDGSADGSIIEKWNCSLSNEDDFPSDGSCVRCGSVPRNANGLCNTCLDEDAERIENTRPTPVAPVSPDATGTVQTFNQIIDYVMRYGGRCRDCADEDGICPTNGTPCEPKVKRAVIEHTLKSLEYGLSHGFIENPFSIPKPDATGKCGELVTVRRILDRAQLWTSTDADDYNVKADHVASQLVTRSQADELLAAVTKERDHWKEYSSGQGKLIESGVFVTNDEYVRLTALEAKLTERDEADHKLIDKYRDPRTGTFSFPGDVATIIRHFETKLAAAEKALEAIEDHAARCFALSTHSTTALAYLKDIQDEARAALGGKPS